MKIVLASSNKNKIKEFKRILEPLDIELITQTELGVKEVPETGVSFEENSIIKSKNAYMQTNLPTIADDSGIEVDALNGEPGIFSARYAGDISNSDDNTKLVLNKLRYKKNRFAHFQTIICLILNDEIEYFEGIIKGRITNSPIGANGFGYDPIFMPMDSNKTFAQFSLEEKNKVSHRAIATKKLINYLNNFSL